MTRPRFPLLALRLSTPIEGSSAERSHPGRRGIERAREVRGWKGRKDNGRRPSVELGGLAEKAWVGRLCGRDRGTPPCLKSNKTSCIGGPLRSVVQHHHGRFPGPETIGHWPGYSLHRARPGEVDEAN